MSIVVFDSGVGGLSILRELRIILPGRQFMYVGDDAGFPYGDRDEESLTTRIVGIFENLLERFQPDIAIVACNTASTLILPALRDQFDIPFIGTVPAIKPAAQRSATGLVTLLGTPATINRQYTRNLINQFAGEVDVNLVGAKGLARIAEDYLLQRTVDTTLLRSEILPCFVESGKKRTDIVILGCTHYPFLANEMRKLAPWPVDWIDPAEAIASHTRQVLKKTGAANHHQQNKSPALSEAQEDLAILTSKKPDPAAVSLLGTFGLPTVPMPELLTTKLVK